MTLAFIGPRARKTRLFGGTALLLFPKDRRSVFESPSDDVVLLRSWKCEELFLILNSQFFSLANTVGGCFVFHALPLFRVAA